MHHRVTFDESAFAADPILGDRSQGYSLASLVGADSGSPHQRLVISQLQAGGSIEPHFHSFEEVVYVLAGRVELRLGNAVHELGPDDFALAQTGTPHSWRNAGSDFAIRGGTMLLHVGKVGQRLFFIQTADIAFFQADNKIVYLIDKEANRYVVEYTLEQLIEMLDPQQFFRLNRSFIVSIHAIQQVKPWFNSRLKLSVAGQNASDEMVVSRDRVPEFRQWAEA